MPEMSTKKEVLVHKTFMLMFRILLLFGIPVAIAYFAGKEIDLHYSIRPYGTLACLLASFIFSWVLVVRLYIKLNKEFAALAKEESEQQKET
ncbi:MAG: AtpZ/AtpI family protein [Candidatus Magasanikbacteria bacterium]|jgi:hypothetical protein|nr:AtpZ/AtpI family protein [Candidatus Magasanikbacteria bacterium]MBT5262786.1 AtpZ/AtpI family protein [Candidatus Magasanikbacteria bacterium]MBT5820046.1 AtpZ/AtpI family protein [Candidatus Magasanikbacteria bacterium]MBT6294368.1 AtpZ/AtpI family protein [Candidatus Magasanikbacteria bacterium]